MTRRWHPTRVRHRGQPGGRSIFISYRRGEAAGHAGHLYEALAERFGEDRVFLDIDVIRPGSDFASTISQALGDSQVLLVIIGPRWLEQVDRGGSRRLHQPNDPVRLELETALDRNINLIPLLVQSAKMPDREDLPPTLAGLADRQAFELSDRWWTSDMARLAAELESLMGASESPRSQVRAWYRHRGSLAMLVMMLAGALGAILAFRLFPIAPGPTPYSVDISQRFPTDRTQILVRLIYDLRGMGCSVTNPQPPAARCIISANGNINTATLHVFATNEQLSDFMGHESRRLQMNGDTRIHLISDPHGLWAIETDGLAGNQVYDTLNVNDHAAGAAWAYP
jgi:TIR domain